jgi:hypothetical protein
MILFKNIDISQIGDRYLHIQPSTIISTIVDNFVQIQFHVSWSLGWLFSSFVTHRYIDCHVSNNLDLVLVFLVNYVIDSLHYARS